jgi:hypothetical protein
MKTARSEALNSPTFLGKRASSYSNESTATTLTFDSISRWRTTTLLLLLRGCVVSSPVLHLLTNPDSISPPRVEKLNNPHMPAIQTDQPFVFVLVNFYRWKEIKELLAQPPAKDARSSVAVISIEKCIK